MYYDSSNSALDTSLHPYDVCRNDLDATIHCYFVVDDVTGDEVTSRCPSGSHVAMIETQEENEFVVEYLRRGKPKPVSSCLFLFKVTKFYLYRYPSVRHYTGSAY